MIEYGGEYVLTIPRLQIGGVKGEFWQHLMAWIMRRNCVRGRENTFISFHFCFFWTVYKLSFLHFLE